MQTMTTEPHFAEELRAALRTIPDYPKKGVQFYDITTLLGDAAIFSRMIDALAEPYKNQGIDKVAGIEARGFILGGAMAKALNAGFVPIRKKGKLPYKKVQIAYSLEYGLDEMEMHSDAVKKGEKVLLIDDLIATGGSATAAVLLLNKIGIKTSAACFVLSMPELGGAAKLRAHGVDVHALLELPA